MAQDAKGTIEMPELATPKLVGKGTARLELKTGKDIAGQLRSTATVVWIHDGFMRFGLGSDFFRTYARNQVKPITQRAIDRQQADVFTPELIEQIKAEVTAFYGVVAKPADPLIGFDYANQAWVKDGQYVPCGHAPEMACNCFGKLHAGEPPAANAQIE